MAEYENCKSDFEDSSQILILLRSQILPRSRFPDSDAKIVEGDLRWPCMAIRQLPFIVISRESCQPHMFALLVATLKTDDQNLIYTLPIHGASSSSLVQIHRSAHLYILCFHHYLRDLAAASRGFVFQAVAASGCRGRDSQGGR